MGAFDQATVEARKMPPWHIDRTVGIQHFKNDVSLSDEQIDDDRPAGSTPARRWATRRICRRRVKWADGNEWKLAKQFGEPNRS